MTRKIPHRSCLLLAVIFLMCVGCVLITALSVHTSDHDCCGSDCPVCALTDLCRRMAETILLPSAFVLLFPILIYIRRDNGGASNGHSRVTPVSLKVKLSN